MLNAEEESLNDGSEIKDSMFAMAATATPKPNNNGFNPSFNRGRGRGNYNHRGGRGGRVQAFWKLELELTPKFRITRRDMVKSFGV
nr:hypothetical protein CFP56_29582 [Quercus suber]